jgi:hypothetical protein
MSTQLTTLQSVWAVLLMLGLLPSDIASTDGPLLTVGKEGAPYATIQAAIDAAPSGAVVRVGPGTYAGGIKIEKPLRLVGDGWGRTTLLAPTLTTAAIEPALREAMRRAAEAKTAEEQQRIRQAFLDTNLRPAVLITKARGVRLSHLKITCQGLPQQERLRPAAHVVVRGAEATIRHCAILGASGSGILLADGAVAEIRDSLVAGLWWTGIEIGVRGDLTPCRASVADCDVRNCYYAGITIRKDAEATIERCRISGAAWHGIRYDDCAPKILGNRIAANYRCGIYASGKTAATVKQNLFVKNNMSCWFENRDRVVENTFAGQGKDGLWVLGASQPVVERNVFFDHAQAVVCGTVNASASTAKVVGTPQLAGNLFWKTAQPLVRRKAGQTPPEESQPVPLAADTHSVKLDPEFVDLQAGDFSLAATSPARRARIGVANPLPLASPWPLQPEEKAIIPDDPAGDERQWKSKIDAPPKPVKPK